MEGTNASKLVAYPAFTEDQSFGRTHLHFLESNQIAVHEDHAQRQGFPTQRRQQGVRIEPSLVGSA